MRRSRHAPGAIQALLLKLSETPAEDLGKCLDQGDWDLMLCAQRKPAGKKLESFALPRWLWAAGHRRPAIASAMRESTNDHVRQLAAQLDSDAAMEYIDRILRGARHD